MIMELPLDMDAVSDVVTDESVACCIFRNILDMGSAEAEYAIHKKKILVVGTSCKDMSRARKIAQIESRLKRAVAEKDSSCSDSCI